jgi:hypothetical protein
MGRDRIPFLISVIMAAAALAVGIWALDMISVGISAVALSLAAASAVYCRGGSLFTVAACSIVLVCVILMCTAVSMESTVINGTLSKHDWITISAIIQGIAILPLIVLFYFVHAAAFNASYNWVLVSGFSIFIGLAMTAPGYALIYFTQRSLIDNPDGGFMGNDVILRMWLTMIMFIVFAVTLLTVFAKKRYLITMNGLEARR